MRDSNSLSAVKIARLNKPGRYSDGGGLYLRVSEWQTKSWLFRFERAGRERQMGLGSIHTVSLAEARQRARQARLLLLDGRDPIEVRKAERAAWRLEAAKAMTFEQCAEAYITTHSPSWKNDKHRAQWDATLKSIAYPVFGKLPVAAVDTGLVLKAIEPIWSQKTDTANRTRGRIETVLDWARARGYREGDNPARWRGHLDQLLPRKSRLAPVKHRPAMPFKEIPSFIAELRKRDDISTRALEFLILTAARTGEVIGAERREIDIEEKLWTVPSTRTKSGREHRVPLSPRAIELLDSLPLPEEADAFVFSGRQPGTPLSNMAMLKLIRDMGRLDFVVHGFRSTFKDWAAETTAHENIVTEMALAHVVGDDVEAAYRRGDLMQKRRALMGDWANFCGSPSSGKGKVVVLRRVQTP